MLVNIWPILDRARSVTLHVQHLELLYQCSFNDDEEMTEGLLNKEEKTHNLFRTALFLEENIDPPVIQSIMSMSLIKFAKFATKKIQAQVR